MKQAEIIPMPDTWQPIGAAADRIVQRAQAKARADMLDREADELETIARENRRIAAEYRSNAK